MDLGSILLILALLIIVIFLISRPFIQTASLDSYAAVDQEEHEISELLAERDQVIDALRELEFDNAIGKIPEEDYPHQRNMMIDHGTSVLKSIDEYVGEHEASLSQTDMEVDERLEYAISERRNAQLALSDENEPVSESGKVAPIDPDDDLEVMIADRKRARNDKSAGFCSRCGGPIQKSDKFCFKCGATLEKET